jgi:hypothetical protein
MRFASLTWHFTLYDVSLAWQRKRFFVYPSAHLPDHHVALGFPPVPGGFHPSPGPAEGPVGISPESRSWLQERLFVSMPPILRCDRWLSFPVDRRSMSSPILLSTRSCRFTA